MISQDIIRETQDPILTIAQAKESVEWPKWQEAID